MFVPGKVDEVVLVLVVLVDEPEVVLVEVVVWQPVRQNKTNTINAKYLLAGIINTFSHCRPGVSTGRRLHFFVQTNRITAE